MAESGEWGRTEVRLSVSVFDLSAREVSDGAALLINVISFIVLAGLWSAVTAVKFSNKAALLTKNLAFFQMSY